MTPRIEACYFTGDGPIAHWARLARVLRWTAAQHCPHWTINIEPLPAQPRLTNRATLSYEHNTQKLDHWARRVAESADGDRVLLLDVDMMIVRSLEPLWTLTFDLAYTRRKPHVRLPLNGGVIALTVSPRVRQAMAAWAAGNRRMLYDTREHEAWRPRYGGINQAAFGAMLETGAFSTLAVHELECLEWNCEETSWPRFDPTRTRIVHVKSMLRRVLLQAPPPPAPPHLKPLIARWRQEERDALAQGVAV